jgi:hypothetical protein
MNFKQKNINNKQFNSKVLMLYFINIMLLLNIQFQIPIFMKLNLFIIYY